MKKTCQRSIYAYNACGNRTYNGMKTYFILDHSSNTWSEEHYRLSAILAMPGICEEQVLSDACTQQVLTVAQARSMQQRQRPAMPAVTQHKLVVATAGAKPSNVASAGVGKAVRGNKPSVGSQLPLSSLPKKQEREYKIISSSDGVFNGNFTLQRFNQVLNNHAKQGWKVISCNTMPAYAADGCEYQDVFALMEREG